MRNGLVSSPFVHEHPEDRVYDESGGREEAEQLNGSNG
jgi:hypothetical protein